MTPDPDPTAPAAALGPVPEANRPGHRPRRDQDKPTGPPPRPPGSVPRVVHATFHFEPALAVPAAAVGVTPWTTGVQVGEHHLAVRFGPWSLRTPLVNVASAEVTGPFAWVKVAGPPHLSLRDGGVTFATNRQAAACVRFHRPVPAALPLGLLRHPAATLTVADPEGFVEELEAAVRRVS